jgi:hypothetical protein
LNKNRFKEQLIYKIEKKGEKNGFESMKKNIPFLNSDEKLTYRTISDLPSMLSYKEQWDSLCKKTGKPILCSSWFIAGNNGFSKSSELSMAAITNGELKAIAPLAKKGKLLPHLELLGSSTLLEPGGIIFDNPEALRLLIKKLLETNISLILKKLYKNSLEVKILADELNSKKSFLYSTEESKVPYVDTSGDWKQVEDKMPSKKRSNFRRLKRKLEKLGEVEFQIVIPSEENLEIYFEKVMDVEAANWKGKMGTAIKTHPSLREFFSDYASQMTSNGQLRLIFLNVNGEPIAVQFAVESGNRLWILKIGYNEKWRIYSPGVLLMDHVVKYCFDQNLDGCEFLGGNEEWLHDWATGVHDLVSYNIYPKTIKGILTKLKDRLVVSYHDVVNLLKYKWVFK